MEKLKVYIGIDPDTHKSGYAVYVHQTKEFHCTTFKFFELYEYLKKIKEFSDLTYQITVIIEAGWLNPKSNFHGGKGKFAGERISKNVGANHETGRKIVEMCEHLKIEYELYRPGNRSKVTPEYFEKLTGVKTRNQEMIDAGMLVWGR